MQTLMKKIKEIIDNYGVRDQTGFLAWMLGIVISVTELNGRKSSLRILFAL